VVHDSRVTIGRGPACAGLNLECVAFRSNTGSDAYLAVTANQIGKESAGGMRAWLDLSAESVA